MTAELAVPGEEIAEAEIVDEHGPAVRFEGYIIIEGPASQPSMVMPAWKISVYDALNGRRITTVSRLEIHASADALVTADLTMYADGEGRPVYGGKPRIKAGKAVEATFPFLVAEMRVRP